MHPEGCGAVRLFPARVVERHASACLRTVGVDSWRCYWFHYIHVTVESHGVKKSFARNKPKIYRLFLDLQLIFSHEYRSVNYCCIIQESRAELDYLFLKIFEKVIDNWVTAELTNRKTWFNFFQEFTRLLLFFVQWKCKLVSQTALYARQTKSKQKQSLLRFLFAKFSINTGVSIPSDAKIKRSIFCQVETLHWVAWHDGRCGVFLYLKGWFSWHFEPPETNLIRTLGLKHSLIESVWE